MNNNTFKPLRKSYKSPGKKFIPQRCQLEADRLREKYFIEVNGNNIPEPILSFDEIKLPFRILNFLTQKKKFEKPTAIQMQAIPCLLKKRDVIALSTTGTGKTFAYLLPMLQLLTESKDQFSYSSGKTNIVSLIVVPTRELVNQVKSITVKLLGLICPKTHSESLQLSSDHHQYVNAFNQNPNYQNQYNQNYAVNMYPHPSYQFDLPHAASSIHNMHQPYPPHSYYMQPRLYSQSEYPFHASQNQITTQNGSHDDLHVVVGVTGGVPISENVSLISNKTRVVIATPGRLIDLCNRQIISLESIKYVVLDECDRLLELGFEEQLRTIIQLMELNETSAQVSLWSATLPESLERLARSATVDPIYICAGIENSIPSNIFQTVTFCHSYLKPKLLVDTLHQIPFPPVLIFTASRNKADEIKNLLLEEQFHVAAIHSDKTQAMRNETMRDFLEGQFDILVATDIASRGLDMPDITHVIHFDLPDTIEDFIHRTGRTGRFGREGSSTSFLTLECKIAKELKDLLEGTNAIIPPELNDVKMFGKKVLKTEMGDRIIE